MSLLLHSPHELNRSLILSSTNIWSWPPFYRTQVSLGSGLLVLVSLSKYIQELFETLLMWLWLMMITTQNYWWCQYKAVPIQFVLNDIYGRKFRQWWTVLQIILPSLTQNIAFLEISDIVAVLWYIWTVLRPKIIIYCKIKVWEIDWLNGCVSDGIHIYHAKKKLVEKILLQNQPKTKFHNMWKILTMIGTSLTKI